MSQKSKSRKSDQEMMRKRLENSLPWSLSRWCSDLFKKEK